MAVYVDNLRPVRGLHGRMMCRLGADAPVELNRFARALGVPGRRHVAAGYYVIDARQRSAAVKAGAKQVARVEGNDGAD